MGAITPIGVGIQQSWENLVLGKSGLVALAPESLYQKFDCMVGGPMPKKVFEEEFQSQNKITMDDPYYSIANALFKETLRSSGLQNLKHCSGKYERDRIGLIISSLGEPL